LGGLFGSWAVMIPAIKEKFNLDDAQLGLLLLSIPLGAMIFNPFAASGMQRMGIRKFTKASMFLICLFYLIPVASSNLLLLAIGLVLAGIGITSLNISINTMATSYQQYSGLLIMSTSHGMFSLGLMMGSLGASIGLGYGLGPQIYMAVVCTGGLLLAIWNFRKLDEIPLIEVVSEETMSFKGMWKFPGMTMVLMIVISVCVNMTEGSMPDWTALYMKEVVQSNPYFFGWGLSGYSLCMALGRFLGDGLIPRIGENAILRYGAILTCFGIGIAIFFPYTITSIIGFSLVGLGVSCCAPILYSSASKVPDLPHGSGLALMNTYAMGGFLFGPVIIGFISEAISLPFALSVLMVLSILWWWLSGKVKLY
jgi:MFS family permease